MYKRVEYSEECALRADGRGLGLSDALEFLQSWFVDQADGEWEHDAGIQIESLDNPGWYLTVGLVGTRFEGLELDRQVINDDLPDWVHWWSDGKTFEAACGPLGLYTALERFRKFVTVERDEAGVT